MPRSIYTGKKFTGLKDKRINIIGIIGDIDDTHTEFGYYDLFSTHIWANYRSASGSEFFMAAAYNYSGEAIFTVNWHTEIKEGMIVLFRDKAYRIVYIDDLEGYRKDIKLHCEIAQGLKADEVRVMLAAWNE